MAEVLNMPKLGFDMEEGTLVRWVKGVGEAINKGEVIAEIETDKATVEVEAQQTGTILKFLAEEDSIVEVGAPIAIIGEEGEDVSAMAGGGNAGGKAETAPAGNSDAPAKPGPATPGPAATSSNGSSGGAAPASENGSGLPEGVKASPLARRMAREEGIDLSQVRGSGPGGRIIRKDIEGFEPGTEAPAAPAIAPGQAGAPMPAAPTYTAPDGADYEDIELTRMRKIVGQRTSASFTHVPHFYVTSEIDMAPALALRKQINANLTPETKVTVNDMIVKAVALTLRQFPNLNTHFHGDKLVRHQRVNVGIAVAVDNGLINVVCHDADRRPVSDMAVDNKRMIRAASEGKIRPEDVEGATFTVSNLGMYDVEHFLAIINPPESGILAVGSAKEVPVVIDGEIKVGTRMKATISIDHRVSDGAEGAQFMKHLRELLENPMKLLI
jgi:pyruvate dehydrogenase E2 component (dihydrolipoamide acetyltransferase)